MSNDDYDEIDDMAEPAGDDLDDVETNTDEIEDGEVSAEGEGGEVSAATKARNEEIAEAESLSVSSKEALRRQLEEEVARFLAKGGKVQEIPPDDSAH